MDNFKSSDDVLAAINQATSDLPSGEEQEQYSFPEVLPDPAEQYLDDDGLREVDRLESEANLREQWKAEETQRMTSEFSRTGEVPQHRTFDEWKTHREIVQPQQNMQAHLAKNLEEFIDRYPHSSANFLKKVRRGEIQMPDELMAVPNALEEWFISSITEDEFRRMSPEAQMELFTKEGEVREPLRTTSLDIAEPRRVVPKRTQVKRQRQTVMPANYTNEEWKEIFMHGFVNFQKNHPEKFRG